MANAIKSFCNSVIERARALEEAGFQLTEAIAQKISPMQLIAFGAFILYGGFLQARHERMVNESCDLRMQIRALQAPAQEGTSSPETFQGCLDRLGGR